MHHPARALASACLTLFTTVFATVLVTVGAARAAAPEAELRPDPSGVTPASSAAEPTVVPRITFEEAVRRALARNPTVGIALSEVQRADALVQEARAGWYPTVYASGSYTHLDHARPPTRTVVMTPNGPVTAAPTLAQDELFGTVTLTVPLVAPQGWTAERHAKDQLHISEESATDVRRLVAQATGNAFLAVIAQRLQLRSNDTAINNAKAHADYAHTRLMGGIGRSIDDVRAQQDLATVLANRQAVLTGLARAREALSVLIGAAEPVDAVEAVDLGMLPSLAAALDEAPSRRPDIAAGRDRVKAAETLRKDVWAYYAPYLAAVGQPFGQKGQAILPDWGWQVQLLLTLPLYDGGERAGIAHERDAGITEARLNLDGALRQARSEVRVAFESMLHADLALASAQDAASLAKRAYDLAVLAYKAGATTNIEVIDAARQFRDADSAAAAASDISRRARLDLLVASGRFP
jgi:outer membrane protein TolC